MVDPKTRKLGTTALGVELVCGAALALYGCRATLDDAEPDGSEAAGTGGEGSGVTTGGAGQVIVIGGVDMGGSLAACSAGLDPPLFEGQAFDPQKPVARVVYSWTSAQQEAELRAADQLLLTGEAPGLGRGYAMDLVHALSTREAPAVPDPLAVALETVFTKYRYGWTNPWATRMGWPGESYGNRLIRIELRDEAWVATLTEWGFQDVYDLGGNVVPTEEALAHPERIALIYFARDGSNGGATCDTFSSGSNGYREFVIGNEAMIKEWSIGTETIRARLESDIADLERFLGLARRCGAVNGASFNSTVICSWGEASFFGGVPAEYANALALPSEYYVPTPRNLVSLIETLEADLFEPDPRIVTPGGL